MYTRVSEGLQTSMSKVKQWGFQKQTYKNTSMILHRKVSQPQQYWVGWTLLGFEVVLSAPGSAASLAQFWQPKGKLLLVENFGLDKEFWEETVTKLSYKGHTSRRKRQIINGQWKEEGGGELLIFTISVWGDENDLEIDSGYGCTTLWCWQ